MADRKVMRVWLDFDLESWERLQVVIKASGHDSLTGLIEELLREKGHRLMAEGKITPGGNPGVM